MVLARALAYIDVHGGDGLTRVAKYAVLNANWLRHRLRATLPAAYDRVCMHECVLTATPLKNQYGVRGLDVAKALLEEGFHSPTVYFPLIVEEALMFEPTETESLQTLEALAEAVERIAQRAVRRPRRAAPRPADDAGLTRRRGARRAPPDPHRGRRESLGRVARDATPSARMWRWATPRRSSRFDDRRSARSSCSACRRAWGCS